MFTKETPANDDSFLFPSLSGVLAQYVPLFGCSASEIHTLSGEAISEACSIYSQSLGRMHSLQRPSFAEEGFSCNAAYVKHISNTPEGIHLTPSISFFAQDLKIASLRGCLTTSKEKGCNFQSKNPKRNLFFNIRPVNSFCCTPYVHYRDKTLAVP